MDVVAAIMVLTIAVSTTVFVVLILGGLKEKEKTVTGFSRIDRSIGAKIELMASVLKKLLLTTSALIIVLTLVVALAGMAVLSNESRTQSEFSVPTIRAHDNITLVKLVRVLPVHDVLNIAAVITQNMTNESATVDVYLVEIVSEPIQVTGVRIPKLVVVGVDDCCGGKYLISCEPLDVPTTPFTCASEYELNKYLLANNVLPITPIEAFIGNRPVFPPLTSVVVASLSDASHLLGYNEPVANVVVIYGYVPPFIGDLLDSVVSEVWIVNEKGAFVVTTEPVSSLKEVMLAVFLSAAVAVVVYSAARSMSPRVGEIADKLMISGFPSWGGAIVYYTVIILCSIIAMIAYSGIALTVGLPASVGHLVLMGAFLLTALAHTPKTGGFVVASKVSPDYFSAKVDVCIVEDLLRDVVSAIKRTEFFVIEELVVKKGRDKAFIRSKSIFSETWGIGVDIEVLITRISEASCRVEVRASDWSIEEISASLTESARSLAISRVRSVIELWMEGYYRSR